MTKEQIRIEAEVYNKSLKRHPSSEQALTEVLVEFAERLQNLQQCNVSGSLPLMIKGLDVETLANTLYDKWSVIIDDKRMMPKDLFTLAIQDIVRGGNDR